MLMSTKQRLLFATSGAIFFALCGLLVLLIGLNLHEGLIRTIGVLMMIGGLMAVIFLVLYLPRSRQNTDALLPKQRKQKQKGPKE